MSFTVSNIKAVAISMTHLTESSVVSMTRFVDVDSEAVLTCTVKLLMTLVE